MKLILALIPVTLTASLALAEPEKPNNPLADGTTWRDLKGDVVGEAAILDGSALFSVTAPYRATTPRRCRSRSSRRTRRRTRSNPSSW